MIATLTVPALGSTATLCVTEPDALDAARAVLQQELATIDEACIRFRPDSELVHLNANAGRPVEVSAALFEAVDIACRAAASSEGLVDPTIGRSLRLAGYDRTFELVLGRDGRRFRARFSSTPGWDRVVLDRRAQTIGVPVGCELDLGATAKALAADRAARIAAARVGSGVLVSLGGDVAVSGEPPATGWSIRIADDHRATLADDGPIVSVRSGGLATSSTTVRRWRAGRHELHHVVDPRTSRPAETPWRTVTVAAASCVDANIASTAALVLGGAAPDWLESHRLPARLVTAAGRSIRVAGWPEEAG